MVHPRSIAALIPGDKNPLSDAERDAFIQMANSGVRYVDMAMKTGRSVGTIKTTMYRLRSQGLVARRYALPDWGTLDVY